MKTKNLKNKDIKKELKAKKITFQDNYLKLLEFLHDVINGNKTVKQFVEDYIIKMFDEAEIEVGTNITDKGLLKIRFEIDFPKDFIKKFLEEIFIIEQKNLSEIIDNKIKVFKIFPFENISAYVDYYNDTLYFSLYLTLDKENKLLTKSLEFYYMFKEIVYETLIKEMKAKIDYLLPIAKELQKLRDYLLKNEIKETEKSDE